MSLNTLGFSARKKLSNSLKYVFGKRLESMQLIKKAQAPKNIPFESTVSSQESLANRLLHLQQYLGQGHNLSDKTMAPIPGQLQHFKWVRRQSTEEYRKQKDMLEFDSIFNQIENKTPDSEKKDIFSKLNETLSFQGKMSIKIDLNLDG